MCDGAVSAPLGRTVSINIIANTAAVMHLLHVDPARILLVFDIVIVIFVVSMLKKVPMMTDVRPSPTRLTYERNVRTLKKCEKIFL